MIQGYKDTRIQGYKDTRIQGYKDEKMKGYNDQWSSLCVLDMFNGWWFLFYKRIFRRKKYCLYFFCESLIALIVFNYIQLTVCSNYYYTKYENKKG